MDKFDEYSNNLLEQSKRFLEKSKLEASGEGKTAYLNATLLLCCSALEAFVCGITTEIKNWENLTHHEKGLLLEKEVKFENGGFVVKNNLRMSRIVDRIELLLTKFVCKKDFKKEEWWSNLNAGIQLRNSLVHPKEAGKITIAEVERTLVAVMDCIDRLFQTIYKKGFPGKKKGLDSMLSFN